MGGRLDQCNREPAVRGSGECWKHENQAYTLDMNTLIAGNAPSLVDVANRLTFIGPDVHSATGIGQTRKIYGVVARSPACDDGVCRPKESQIPVVADTSVRLVGRSGRQVRRQEFS
jgi:hypothetical protein